MASAQFIHPIIRINGVSFFFYRIIGTNGGTSVFHEIIGINGGNRCVYSLNFLGPFTSQPTRIHPHPQGINIQIIKIPHMIQQNRQNFVGITITSHIRSSNFVKQILDIRYDVFVTD